MQIKIVEDLCICKEQRTTGLLTDLSSGRVNKEKNPSNNESSQKETHEYIVDRLGTNVFVRIVALLDAFDFCVVLFLHHSHTLGATGFQKVVEVEVLRDQQDGNKDKANGSQDNVEQHDTYKIRR